MPPEVLARIFEPFFTSTRERGTGLSLAQVYGIVARHGERIKARSGPETGTTLTPRRRRSRGRGRRGRPRPGAPGSRALGCWHDGCWDGCRYGQRSKLTTEMCA